MQYTQLRHHHIIRIDAGKMVHATLHEYCNRHEIPSALVQGNGDVEFVRYSVYNREQKKYVYQESHEHLQVTHFNGTITRKHNSPYLLTYGIFTTCNYSTFGGKIDEMRVATQFEIILTPLSAEITRLHNEATGLDELDLYYKR